MSTVVRKTHIIFRHRTVDETRKNNVQHSIIVVVSCYGDDDAADGVRKSYGRHKMYIDTATYGCIRQYVTGRYLNAIIYKYNIIV